MFDPYHLIFWSFKDEKKAAQPSAPIVDISLGDFDASSLQVWRLLSETTPSELKSVFCFRT